MLNSVQARVPYSHDPEQMPKILREAKAMKDLEEEAQQVLGEENHKFMCIRK